MQINRAFIIFALSIIVLSIVSGALLGHLSVPNYQPPQSLTTPAPPEEAGQDIQQTHDTRIHVAITNGSHFPSVLKELQYALESGIYSFVLSTPLPTTEAERSELSKILERIQRLDEHIQIWLAFNCNPSASWLRNHPNDKSTIKHDGMIYPSLGSAAWISSTQAQLEQVLNTLQGFMDAEYLTGVVLEGLENGDWTRSNAYDQSLVHQKAFQEWLAEKYTDSATLQVAWNDETLSEWSSIPVPTPAMPDAFLPVFYTPETEAIYIDYHRFINETTTSTINALADTIKNLAPPTFTVHASYGNALEYSHAASGNWGTHGLDAALIDGLTTFPLTQEKGVGHHAFLAAPPYTHQQWLSIDPIYTGIQYEKSKDDIQVSGTYQPKQIDNLMTRNAGVTALHNIAWAWSDPKGVGTLAHAPLWSNLSNTLALRTTLLSDTPESPAQPNLVVVMDEASMDYVRDDDFMSNVFSSLQQSITHAGIEVQWTTLEKFLSATETPTVPVYLFPNLFHITDENRELLHDRLATEGATAIWLYAPGYLLDTAKVENVIALTGIETIAREVGSLSGSRFVFTGTWIEESQEFGPENAIPLLLKSADEQADPLARYRDNDDISAAMKYLETGWTSIVHYEPTLTPEFLHDILAVLQVSVHLSEISIDTPTVLYTNSRFTLIHPQKDTTMQMEFEDAYDISNLLNTQQGWSNTRSVDLSLSKGETVILEYH